ncbi:MAG TPA: hypothetical protein VMU27_02985 [Candidatus Paceibacterota bacterium]|nr:hypothetical protein [Candidatus Paceibacterota bacterium]
MRPSPVGTFLKFIGGFFLFLSLSFGLTIAVSSYAKAQDAQQAAAAAISLMLK